MECCIIEGKAVCRRPAVLEFLCYSPDFNLYHDRKHRRCWRHRNETGDIEGEIVWLPEAALVRLTEEEQP